MKGDKILKFGDEVVLNTNDFCKYGFWMGEIYIVNTVTDNKNVTLQLHGDYTIGKEHLELVKAKKEGGDMENG
jgi:hypothetical protein